MESSSQTPSEIRHRIWTELGRAALDRHHAWRTPVLATAGEDGRPHARTIVLRETDAKTSYLHFYSDGRSAKIAQLSERPDAQLVFWSKRLNWQLRVEVCIEIHAAGPAVDSVWARVSQSPAAADYLSPSAPGSALSAAQLLTTPSRHHLVVLSAKVHEIDWLELARAGHRRARLSTVSWEWLTP